MIPCPPGARYLGIGLRGGCMKLTVKLVLAFTAASFLILMVDSVVVVRGRAALFEEGAQLDMKRFGRLLRDVLSELQLAKGKDAVAELSARFSREHPNVGFRVLPSSSLATDSSVPLNASDLRRLGEGEQVVRVESTPRNADRLVVYTAFDSQILEVHQSLSVLRRYVRAVWIRSLVVAAVMVLAGSVASLLLGFRTVGKPLQEVIAKARRVGAGDLSGPLRLRRRDELRELADALNDMCERLREANDRLRQEAEARVTAVEQLRHGDRLRTVGRLASGVAHEIGTPLNVISGRAQLLTDQSLTGQVINENAAIIKRQADRIARIVRGLLDFSRRSIPRRVAGHLLQVLRETAELLHPIARKSGVEIRLPEVSDAQASIDMGQMQQLFTNLIMNAIQAMPSGGTVTMAVQATMAACPEVPNAAQRPYWRISVSDTGCGIPPEHLGSVFEPFFSTKDVGEGTGLGLSIAYGIAREHGGWIEVESKVGGGSCFSVYLPREDAQ